MMSIPASCESSVWLIGCAHDSFREPLVFIRIQSAPHLGKEHLVLLRDVLTENLSDQLRALDQIGDRRSPEAPILDVLDMPPEFLESGPEGPVLPAHLLWRLGDMRFDQRQEESLLFLVMPAHLGIDKNNRFFDPAKSSRREPVLADVVGGFPQAAAQKNAHRKVIAFAHAVNRR